MDALQNQKPPFGLIYTSNVIQGAGYGALFRLPEIAQTLRQLPVTADVLTVQSVGNIVGPDGQHWRSRGPNDWPYLVLRGLGSVFDYLQLGNPDLDSALYGSSPVTIRDYPKWSGLRFSWNEAGMFVQEEEHQQQAA